MSRVCLILILIPSLWLAGRCLSAQEEAPVAWQTGSAVDRQLEQPLTASWKEIPLREMLQTLARSQRVAIFLDRRVDPGRLVQFDATGDSLAVVLTRLTGQLQLGYCLVDSTVYIGPPEITGKLATVAEVLHQFLGQLPEPWNKRAAKRVAMKWDLLASPRRLVTEQLQQAGMQVAMPESIPHDLWAAGELPPMPLAHRLAILLAGFNRAFTMAGDPPRMSLLPMPEEVTLRRVYRKSVSTANFQRIRDFFPDLQVTRSAKELTAVGRQEDHRQLARLLRGEQVTTPKPGPVNKRYRLKVEQGTIRQILEEIARQDGLQLDVDEESRQRWDKLTDLDARDVTIEKLLEMVLSPAKLAGRVEGKTLIIRPAKP
jgi:hypothetical protein